MLSFTRPSPVTFTEKGLPGGGEEGWDQLKPVWTQYNPVQPSINQYDPVQPSSRHVLLPKLHGDDAVAWLSGAAQPPDPQYNPVQPSMTQFQARAAPQTAQQ